MTEIVESLLTALFWEPAENFLVRMNCSAECSLLKRRDATVSRPCLIIRALYSLRSPNLSDKPGMPL